MKINELIAEQTDLDEGIGSFLGKAAGHVAGAAGAAWRDAKQGYKDAKAVWDPKDPAGTYNNDPVPADSTAPQQAPVSGNAPASTAPAGGNAPAPQQAPAPQGGNAPAPQQAPAPQGGNAPEPAPQGGNAPAPQQAPAPANSGAIGSIMQAVDKLDPATKKQLAGELEKSLAAAPAAEPNANQPAPAAGATTSPAPASTGLPPGVNPEKANAAQQAAGLPPLYKPTADGGWEETDQAKGTFVGDKTQAAPTTAPASTTPPTSTATPTTPPAGGKLTQAQQDAMKAKLQGQRQAGKTTASQTGSGFKNYVGGSGERQTGVDASGAPIFQKIQRESVEFRSNFLGMMI